ncbi:MAG: MFS transporter [Emcibacter sp.]|nr:MFS transporter [Emcibacter sp.]
MSDMAVEDNAGSSVKVGFKSWWMVAVLFSLYVFSWVDRLILSMIIGPIKADLMLSDFEISLILGPAFAIFYAIFGLPLGWAVDRYPRRWVIFFGVTLWGLATMSCGFARSFVMLMLGRIGVGVGEASLMPAAYSLLADEFPREKLTLATSVYQMAGKVGSALAFGLGGVAIAFAETLRDVDWPLIGHVEPWQLVLMMVGAPGLLLAFLVFTFSEPPRKGVSTKVVTNDQGEIEGPLKIFFRENWKLIILMMIGFSSVAVCGFTLTSWVPEYLSRQFNWKPIEYGPALSVMNLFAAATLLVNGKIVDTLYVRGMKDVHLRFYLWLMLAISPAAIFIFIVSNPYVFLGLYGVIQIITVPFMIYVSTVIAMLAPNEIRGRLIAIFLFSITIFGMGVGPTLVGALTDFVFQDEAKIGSSIGIVVGGAYFVAIISVFMALRYLRPAIEAAENKRSETLGSEAAPQAAG